MSEGVPCRVWCERRPHLLSPEFGTPGVESKQALSGRQPIWLHGWPDPGTLFAVRGEIVGPLDSMASPVPKDLAFQALSAR